MGRSTNAPDTSSAQVVPAPAGAVDRIDAAVLIVAMLESGQGMSDLIFSPGRPPQVEQHGELARRRRSRGSSSGADDTARVARDLIGRNEQALRTLKEQGACDLSYMLPERARFRVNVFRQRGTFAIVMRVIAVKIPTVAELNLPRRRSARSPRSRTASCW